MCTKYFFERNFKIRFFTQSVALTFRKNISDPVHDTVRTHARPVRTIDVYDAYCFRTVSFFLLNARRIIPYAVNNNKTSPLKTKNEQYAIKKQKYLRILYL